MERLTERLNNLKRGVSQMDDKEEIKVNKNFLKYVCEYLEQLKSYKDAEEQGLLLRLPCPIRSEVWKIVKQRDNFSDEPYRIATCVNFRLDMLSEIGKTVFLTKEEAEQALAERSEV